MKRILIILMFVGFNTASATTQSPYAGAASNQIKSLSDSEIDGLLQGSGMGFAKVSRGQGWPRAKRHQGRADRRPARRSGASFARPIPRLPSKAEMIV